MPTLSLAIITKNEAHNLPILLDSCEGAFEEIIVVDTGSTDDTVEIAKRYGAKVFHFDWVNDFAKARNFAFSKATQDYICWFDSDDSLSDKAALIQWKNSVMGLANYWLATYHYASNAEGVPVCSFARERVVRRSANYQWKYFVHEGIVPEGREPVQSLYASTWSVIHRRTAEDLAKDKGRNLKLFEANAENIDSRMLYYWGKELFENGKPLEGYTKLVEAAKKTDLDFHDRVLAIQYGATAAQVLKQFPESIDLAIRGLQLAPGRAEFFALIGDALCAQNQIQAAIPYFTAAKNCHYEEPTRMAPPIFTAKHTYTVWPRLQLGRVYFNQGRLEEAQAEVKEALRMGAGDEGRALLSEIEKIQAKVVFPSVAEGIQTEDIVISCPPVGIYEWDEDVYRTYGCGGSETAAIEMARHLSEITGRNVLIFNNRETVKTFGKVSYHPSMQLSDYFNTKIPKVHIAWRHTEKLTNAPTYIWCHDLMAQGIERAEKYDFVFALSEFHKQYLSNLFGVPAEKIIVSRNGIDPTRWVNPEPNKENVVVWSSSPDRGIERALQVMDLVVKEMPEVKFKAYYGFDNMLKLGKTDHVFAIQQMFNERPWAEMCGNQTQSRLTEELSKAKVWLYPTNFLETFAITAIEMALSQVYPVVREFGALPNTLSGIPSDVISRDCESPGDREYYAERVIAAIREEKWKQLHVDPTPYSWHSVAREWVKLFHLE